ncbi:hypothetical protein Thena_1410 [Thermodesulfobium narugense DSM 14796]|uniref:Uncharacterized protein n=1 Tax=Thermodesulfobium narugense DSM 14796 TaxID=747365 RepID=M1E8L6_9BACT|nr:hypothetical protein [Thermodesulfobium narugense]AEE15025.1 hypothetical protein Thena_1410 [Thermodesulfobium narugense DSM 14796]
MKYLLLSLIFLCILSGVSHALMWSPDDPNRPKVMPESSTMSNKSSNSSQGEATLHSNNQHINQSSQMQNYAANQNSNIVSQNYKAISPNAFYLQMLAIFVGVVFSLFLFFRILKSK